MILTLPSLRLLPGLCDLLQPDTARHGYQAGSRTPGRVEAISFAGPCPECDGPNLAHQAQQASPAAVETG